MMLMLERFDCKKLELAMLLDEPPYYQFESSTSCGEPWRPDGPLVQAAMSIDLEGYAWLYVAYISDRASTWGTKRVKLLSGGTILRKELNSSGVWTGNFAQLSFETVAPSLFDNIVGEPTSAPYNVISRARIQEHPEEALDDEKGDELLGREEEQVEKSEEEPVRFGPRPELGCIIGWQNENRGSQKWWIQVFDDYKSEKWWLRNFGDCRFALTEYQRRPFVRLLLGRLGFVKSVDPGSGRKRVIGLDEVCRGHLRNVVASLRAMSNSGMQKTYAIQERKEQDLEVIPETMEVEPRNLEAKLS